MVVIVVLVAAEIVPTQADMLADCGPLLAFAGIGHPDKFFRMLDELGLDIIARHGFPDHYAYPPAILRRLVNDALAADAMLVTTEKDAVRLPPAYRHEVMTVQVRLVLENWQPIDDIVTRLLPAD